MIKWQDNCDGGQTFSKYDRNYNTWCESDRIVLQVTGKHYRHIIFWFHPFLTEFSHHGFLASIWVSVKY